MNVMNMQILAKLYRDNLNKSLELPFYSDSKSSSSAGTSGNNTRYYTGYYQTVYAKTIRSFGAWRYL